MGYYKENCFPTINSFVFPSTYRNKDLRGKYTSELNFTNIIKTLADKDSFVVGFTDNMGNKINKVAATGTAGTLEIVIDGYYFCLESITITPNFSLYIRAIDYYLKNFATNDTVMDDTDADTFYFTGISKTSTDGAGNEVATGHLDITDADGNVINQGYIEELTDGNGNWLDLRVFFKFLTDSGIGSSIQPIYLDNSEGFRPIKGPIGQRDPSLPTARSQPAAAYQNAYVKANGELTRGQRTYIHMRAPLSTDSGVVGDL